MKTLFSKWNSISLIKRIIAGLIIGVLLAVAVPQASFLSILGDLFVGALKDVYKRQPQIRQRQNTCC